jgi:ATP-dependent Lhr-like helicase
MSDSGVASAFDHLGERVRQALAERDFDEPTLPQQRAIPPIARGEHALVVAPTGTGKTETAMLPIFDALAGDAPDGFGALYITPLRALNRDMRDRLDWWGETLDLDVQVRHGDTTDYQRQQQANDPPDVLVTTPETLQAMLTGDRLREGLEDTAHVVVDEVHELAASKRGAQLAVGLERLRELAGPFQRVGLSATVGDPDTVGAFLTGDRGCAIAEIDAGSRIDVSVRRPQITATDERRAAEHAVDATMASHCRVIAECVRENDSTLVFVNTRQTAEALGARLRSLDLGVDIGVHHGSLAASQRVETEDAFKAGDIDALLCTSSMELGIDVGRVDHVVQYQSPREVTRLLQRVGRAGHRADAVSRGTVITTRPDDTLEALAIVRRAMDGDVESAAIHEGSLDTLANQVVGVVMDHGEIAAPRAYQIVTRAYPFRAVDREQFKAVIRELSGNRLLWLDEGEDRLEKTGGTWRYFYANLSMIPDEESYEVYDMAAGRRVGTLDERFVRDFAENGATFVQRGDLWRVVEVDHDEARLRATPIEDPDGEIPSWVGQEIPVPEGVAQHVGRLRERAATAAAEATADTPDTAIVDAIAADHPADGETLSRAAKRLAGHADEAPMPTADRIVVETGGERVVLNAAFGHRSNETLGRLCAALVGQRVGATVGLETDPYRIELDVPSGVSGSDVVDCLETTDPEHVRPVLELSLKDSQALRFRLAQVARTFGTIGTDADRDRPPIRRLQPALEGTPVYEEALREVFHEDLAVDAAADVLTRLQHDDLALVTVGGRTPLGRGGRSSGTELLAPDDADAGVIDAVRERLQESTLRLVCLACGEWDRRTKVSRVDDQPRCPECEATRLAVLHPAADEVRRALSSTCADRDEDLEKRVRRAHRTANLVQAHGKQAVIALAARGVGPQTAARIIANLREDETDFYRDILEQERQYARTKAFWD